MRLTSQTNLNLDMTNLAAFPPTKKLERWLRSNPQEIVPMCDQVLKESVDPITLTLTPCSESRSCIIDLAIQENVAEEEIEEMESRIYKIRPFGSSEKGRNAAARERAGIVDEDEQRRLGVNMRDLGPGGECYTEAARLC